MILDQRFPGPGGRRGFLMGSALAATTALASLASLAQAAQGGAAARRMPVIFIGHGSPMNALADNAFTRRLAAWGRELPRPAAILSVSAHWLSRGATGVGVQERPKTIHDFGGFPQALFDIDYPAPGHPALARAAAGAVARTRVVETRQWGLDHGTWTVLRHLYPKADVPVFQLSIDYDQPAAFHHAVGRDLAALRDQGVLVMGSGNVVHNLRATDRGTPDARMASRPWAQSFDDAVKATPDHYFPLLYALGAAAPDERARTVYEGFQSGTLSMRCLQFG